MTEFKAFKKIKRISDMQMSITQKMHGTNAHILITKEVAVADDGSLSDAYIVKAGSRNRYVTVGNDNYGFAAFVESNKDELIAKLGEGRHDGEWCGLGINSGEGLKEKWFLLFDWWRFPEERPLPPQVGVVPILYQGPIDTTKIDECMTNLKENGSVAVKGFMRPEGVVVMINGQRFKKVFKPEDTKWTGGDPNKVKTPSGPQVDYSYLCQPIRLEKLISKDEAYTRDYPVSLPSIVKAYVEDLIEEGEIKGDKGQIKGTTKGASRQIFTFIRTIMEA